MGPIRTASPLLPHPQLHLLYVSPPVLTRVLPPPLRARLHLPPIDLFTLFFFVNLRPRRSAPLLLAPFPASYLFLHLCAIYLSYTDSYGWNVPETCDRGAPRVQPLATSTHLPVLYFMFVYCRTISPSWLTKPPSFLLSSILLLPSSPSIASSPYLNHAVMKRCCSFNGSFSTHQVKFHHVCRKFCSHVGLLLLFPIFQCFIVWRRTAKGRGQRQVRLIMWLLQTMGPHTHTEKWASLGFSWRPQVCYRFADVSERGRADREASLSLQSSWHTESDRRRSHKPLFASDQWRLLFVQTASLNVCGGRLYADWSHECSCSTMAVLLFLYAYVRHTPWFCDTGCVNLFIHGHFLPLLVAASIIASQWHQTDFGIRHTGTVFGVFMKVYMHVL